MLKHLNARGDFCPQAPDVLNTRVYSPFFVSAFAYRNSRLMKVQDAVEQTHRYGDGHDDSKFFM